jgi:hypothetical protein
MTGLFQFSMRSLLISVALLAVGITALVNANGWWEASLWGLVLFMLVLAVLLAIYRRDDVRAYWLGFAALGWSYFAMFLFSQMPAQTQFWIRSDPLTFDRLIVTRLASLAYVTLLPSSRTTPAIPGPLGTAGSSPGSMGPAMGASMPGGPGDLDASAMIPGMPGGMGSAGMGSSPMGGSGMGMPSGPPPMIANPKYVVIENFVQIFHAVCLVIVACAGGTAAKIIYRSRRPAAAS